MTIVQCTVHDIEYGVVRSLTLIVCIKKIPVALLKSLSVEHGYFCRAYIHGLNMKHFYYNVDTGVCKTLKLGQTFVRYKFGIQLSYSGRILLE